MANPKSPGPPLKPTAGAGKISRPNYDESRGGQNPQSEAAVEFTSGSVEETQAFGERLGRVLRPGDVVALYGELGSGKTTLIQGIARGLGRNPETVKSPTFVLMREYPPANRNALSGARGDIPLIHIDGYRLEGAPAVSWLDVELLFSPHTITLIEWAERFGELLPEEHVRIELEHISANRRRIHLVAQDSRFHQFMTVEMQQHTRTETKQSARIQAHDYTGTPDDVSPRD